MISITQIALLLASATLLVSAGPTPVPADIETPSLAAIELPTALAVPEAPEGLTYTGDPNFPGQIIEARDGTDASTAKHLNKRNGMLYCGSFMPANYRDASYLVEDMGNSHPNTYHSVDAHGCRRVACNNTSAVYVCNDRSTGLSLNNAEIVKHTVTIRQKCCIHNAYGGLDEQAQSEGQQFTDALGGNFNVIIAYGNCNHADTRKPDTYGHPTGAKNVNGWGCFPAQMYIG